MAKTIFVNLPVTDVARATAFYEALGFERNPQFSNEVASAMVWSDTISFMLLGHDFFRTFTPLPIADGHAATGALYALSFDSRDGVDAIVTRAGEAGGTADVRPAQDMGFMYSRAFADPDGHIFEPMWMDMAGFAAAQASAEPIAA
jgi:predicted lactoylglutathione lyase